MEFQIAFHVQEDNQSGAEEWLRRAKAILDAHQNELIAPHRMIAKPDGGSTGVGSYCPGHIMISSGQPEQSPADVQSNVLHMGPRE